MARLFRAYPGKHVVSIRAAIPVLYLQSFATTSTTVSVLTNQARPVALTKSVVTAATLLRTSGKSLTTIANLLGKLLRQPGTIASYSITTTGTIKRATAQSATVSITATGLVTRQPRTSLVASSLATAGGLARIVNPVYRATATTSSAILRLVSRLLLVSLVVVGAANSLIKRVLASVSSTSGALFSRVGKLLSTTVSLPSAINSQTGQIISGVAVTVPSLLRAISSHRTTAVVVNAYWVVVTPLDFAFTVITTGTYSRVQVLIRIFNGVTATTGSLIRYLSGKTYSASVAITTSLANKAGKLLIGSITASALPRVTSVVKSITAPMNIAGAVADRIFKSLIESIGITPTEHHFGTKVFTSQLTAVPTDKLAMSTGFRVTAVVSGLLPKSVVKSTLTSVTSAGSIAFSQSLVRVMAAIAGTAGNVALLTRKTWSVTASTTGVIKSTLRGVYFGIVNTSISYTTYLRHAFQSSVTVLASTTRQLASALVPAQVFAVGSVVTGKVLLRVYLGAINMIVNLPLRPGKSLPAEMVATSVWYQYVRRFVAATVAMTPNSIDLIGKPFNFIVTVAPSITRLRVRLIVLPSAVLLMASKAVQTTKSWTAAAANSASSFDQVGKLLTVSGLVTPSIMRAVFSIYGTAIVAAVSLVDRCRKTTTVVVVSSAGMDSSAGKSLVTAVGSTVAFTISTLVKFKRALSAAPAMSNGVVRTMATAVGLTGNAIDHATRYLRATVVATVSRIALTSRALNATSSATAIVARLVRIGANTSIATLASSAVGVAQDYYFTSVSVTSVIVNRSAKTLFGTASSVAVLIKRTVKSFAGSVGVSGLLAKGAILYQTLLGTISSNSVYLSVKLAAGLVFSYGAMRFKWFTAELRIRWSAFQALRSRWRI